MTIFHATSGGSGYAKSALVNGDHVQSMAVDSMALPSTLVSLRVGATTTPAQLTSSATPVKSLPILVADPDNTAAVIVYPQGGTAAANGVRIGAGVPVPFAIDDLSKLMVVSVSGTQYISAVAGA
jgi:hypothetical protein